MIDLTEEQRQELGGPDPAQVRDPVTGATYVLVRADLYERLRHLLQDDDSLGKREVAILVERAMKEYDEGDPTLGLYQDD